MNEAASGARPARRSGVGRFARLSTGMKLFLVLSLALLPLGLIALFASLQSTRNSDVERASLLRVALNESARRLGAEIGADAVALRIAVDAAEEGSLDAQFCARTSSLLSATKPSPVQFGILDSAGRSLCRSPGFTPSERPMRASDTETSAFIDTARHELRVRVRNPDGSIVGRIVYPEPLLASIGRPGGELPPYDLWLKQGGEALTLRHGFARGPLDKADSLAVRIRPIDLVLEMSVRRQPFTASELLTMLLPILMWLAAALIGWLVVDRLLLSPLVQLRRSFAGYQPGEVIEPLRRMTIPAREVRALSRTFRLITETVASHEAELAEGLARQRKLTREVHHRVKNNLQVVASLISLHARAARSAEATSAYATIGRRVDALAVVHRNHYAELEANRGVNLRGLVGEIASNLRATAPVESAQLSIALDLAPCFVTQDVAVPVAFLITELVELAMSCDPAAAITIRLVCGVKPERGELTISSPALADTPALQEKLAQRFGRVIEGLARQLRSELRRSPAEGAFIVDLPVVD